MTLNEMYEQECGQSAYKNKLPYPPFSDVSDKAKKIRQAHQAEDNRLQSQFRQDMIAALLDEGLEQKRAEKVYAYCWQQGHSSGYADVLSVAMDLIDMLK